MSLKIVLLAALLLLVAGWFAVNQNYNAGMLEWELNNRVPTSSVRDSQALGIFERSLAMPTQSFVLGGRRYQIAEVWLEHQIEPQRVNVFTTKKVIHRELILCVQVKSLGDGDFTPSHLEIKDASTVGLTYHAANDVLFTVVGTIPPTSVTLRDRDTQQEATVAFKS